MIVVVDGGMRCNMGLFLSGDYEYEAHEKHNEPAARAPLHALHAIIMTTLINSNINKSIAEVDSFAWHIANAVIAAGFTKNENKE